MKTYVVIKSFRSKSLGKKQKRGDKVRYGKERAEEYKRQGLIREVKDE